MVIKDKQQHSGGKTIQIEKQLQIISKIDKNRQQEIK
jgi:hypothetical protein